MDRLKGKVAIVTGAAKGLGEADARLFAQEGAQVIVADVDVENGERVARDIGPRAKFVRLDVRHEAEWQRVIAEVMKQYGRLDILVNNAGVVEMHTPETITEEEYRFVMAVSIDGTVFGCKHAIPAMKKSGGGSIINMASVASLVGEYTVAGYCAAKGAIEAYTRAVAVYCAQDQIKIRCNSIHPAAIDTPMVRSVPDKMAKAGMPAISEEQKGSVANPMGRPIDIAYLALYLASDESVFVSGQQFVVDNTATVTMGTVPGGGSIAAVAGAK
ncbi:MAG: SDR family oxidoreductase [Terriglobales bacterium]